MAESSSSNGTQSSDANVQLTCFTEESHDVTLHFQIISLTKQIYIWIGCNSAKLGHLYAGAATRPNNTASVTSLLGGGADSTGAGIARRLVLRTGLNIILACNIPKNSPMLEALAERLLIQKLNSLGYSKDGQKRLSAVNAN
uniref:Proteasome assembly chaperone 4 n=1 Tax=Picea sitchensis TaxID=3332 RepID=D5ABL4_PICSI|nr:unknown [Picea sitchensis]